MSDKMTPIPFAQLMNWILEEYRRGSVFGVKRAFHADAGKQLPLFGEIIETPFGPAAGPHTQLAQNMIAAYYAGARFFELKTVQTLDGDDLPVSKPCILAEDECYNCEWSTELYVPQAFEEYVKAWYAIKLLSREFSLGEPNGFVFNMSVGYDYQGITSEKIDSFIEGLKDAAGSPAWRACEDWARQNLSLFTRVDDAYLDTIDTHVCTSITLSTLHGCPPQEIERIASYLIREKKLHTFVKCNPTILGYDYARRTLDELGYGYVSFDAHHFLEDLQYADAVPMFRRLMTLAKDTGVDFGLKLSNTFPVEVTKSELPSEEMYMSGRALYPLTMEMARRMADEFDGQLRLSYSGGADVFHIVSLYQAGVWPITMATTLLKPGGYQRLTQMAEELYRLDYVPFAGVHVGSVEKLADQARVSSRCQKPIKPLPVRKIDKKVPLTECFLAPCTEGCPIRQDIPAYLEQVGQNNYAEALRIILNKNPLPFITGTICPHRCMTKCTRNFYEEPIRIRTAKLTAAENGLSAVLAERSETEKIGDTRVAVIGGGPAGIALAGFLAEAGIRTTIYEKRAQLGGIVRYVIPRFRIDDGRIDSDIALMEKLGVTVHTNTEAPAADALFAAGYTDVIYAVGAWSPGRLAVSGDTPLNVLSFLEDCKAGKPLSTGSDVVVVGGGNTAMDAARVAKRLPGVQRVSIVYRRTAHYMPADEEEMQQALAEGVRFLELLSPVEWHDGELTLDVMTLGAKDASGRRSPVSTGERTRIPCTALIAAVGEQLDTDLFVQNGIGINAKGKATVDESLMCARPHVYVIGDARRGPATVVEAIADAATVASAISGARASDIAPSTDVETCASRHGILQDYQNACGEENRCLACSSVCTCCVEVCPNRANIAIQVAGLPHAQIVHVDRLCNECGNCRAFCPYDSAPYLEKFTLFGKEKDIELSHNPGFYYLGGKTFKVRLPGEDIAMVDLEHDCSFNEDLKNILMTVIRDYSYLLY